MNLNKNVNRFSFEISSDLDYEKMVVNLNFSNTSIAILNCDKGKGATEIELLNNDDYKVIWKFDFKDFVAALNKAYEKLMEANEE